MGKLIEAGTREVAGLTRPACLTILLLAVALMICAPVAPAAGGGTVVHELGADGKLSRAQISRAEPLDPFSRDLPTGPADASGRSAGRSTGEPGFVEGTIPPGIAVATAAARAGAQASGFGNFTSRPVGSPSTYPNTAIGRVIGTIPGVGTYSCSASVVHARNRSTLFTAGHCVKKPGGNFASRLTFVPSYDRGSAPFGSWSAKSVLVKRAWSRKGNSNFDFAAAVLRPNPSGRIENVVGSLGFAYNVKPKKKRFRAVGYPFNRGQTERMWECLSRFGGFDPGYQGPGPRPIGIGCDMLNGASGGPWTIPGLYLNSVSSFAYNQLRGRLFGPQFTKTADRLRRAAGRS